MLVCPYCRAELAESERERHDQECAARRWWLETYGPPAGEGPRAPEPVRALEKCRFCGWEFERHELTEHLTHCGQKKWMLLNFQHEGEAPRRRPRPPPLPEPEPPRARWPRIIAQAVERFTGPDRSLDHLRWMVRALNAVRDDEVFASAHPGALGVLAAWTMIGVPNTAKTPAERTRTAAVIAQLERSADLLVKSATLIEGALDRLHALAPGKNARELAYLEDRGASLAELEAKRALLADADLVESEVELERARLAEISKQLEKLPRVLGGGEGPDLARAIRNGINALEDRLARPSLASKPPPRAAQPAYAEPRARELAPTTPRDASGGAPEDRPALTLDRATFDRLSPQGCSLAKTKQIGDYRIIGLLGSGGMGIVYEARSPGGKRVALKTVRLSEDTHWDDVHLRRFQRECRILQGLDHPGCVKLIDAGEHDGEIYLVLRLIEGVPLSAILRERRLTVEETIGLGLELARALGYLHNAGIVHRDLKPANVIIRRDGHAVIADFGISRATEDTQITDIGDVVGTPGYVAPEVVTGGEITPAADQWSLGRLLFRCASGGRAYATPSSSEGSFKSRLQSGTLVEWSAFPAAREWSTLRAVLARMLADAPELRYASVADVERALRGLNLEPALPAGPARELSRG